MSTSIERGKAVGIRKAVIDEDKYLKAESKFGSWVGKYRGQVPRGLIYGHIMLVNPTISTNPTPKNNCKGFLMTPFSAALEFGIDYDSMLWPEKSAYAFGRAFNQASSLLYTNHKDMFLEPTEDFWKCAYLLWTLGGSPFDFIWKESLPKTAGKVYPELVYTVNDTPMSFPGWPSNLLKKAVFTDCEYVYEVCRRHGGFRTDGFGREAYLDAYQATQLFQK